MKLTITLAIACFFIAMAQSPSFNQFIIGEADVDEATFIVNVQNISPCVIDTMTVRVMHNELYKTTDTLLITMNLAVSEQSTYAASASQVFSESWMWTIDAINVSGRNCDYEGEILFDRADFGTPLINSGNDTVTDTAPEETTNNAEVSETSENASATEAGQLTGTEPENIENNEGMQRYTIQEGDTLWNIAQQFNSTVDAIVSANNLSGSTITVGRSILIPSLSSANPSPTSSVETQFSSYIIQEGDSLWQIASENDTSVDILEQVNCFSPGTVLSVGEELRIPVGEVTNFDCP